MAGPGDDLRRFTDRLPIAARPPRVIYQLSLFARRNRAAAIGIVGVIAAVAVGFTTTVLQLRRTRIAEGAAVVARNAAKESQHRAEAQAYETSMAAAEAAFSAGDAPLLLQRLAAAPADLRGWEWNDALRRAGEDITLLEADPDGTACRRISAVPDKHIAAIWEKSTVRVWDLPSQNIRWTINLKEDLRDIRCVRGCDRLLVITTPNGHVLSARDGSIISTIPVTHPGVVSSLSHDLYDNLDAVWNSRAVKLNARLAEMRLPVHVENMSSVWTVCYSQPSRYNWLFQYYLRVEDLALSWVGTGRFIFSLNYSDADFDAVADRFVAAAKNMQDDGWWWSHSATTNRSLKLRVLREMLLRKLRVALRLQSAHGRATPFRRAA